MASGHRTGDRRWHRHPRDHAAEAAIAREALAIAAVFLAAAPRNLREEYEPHTMERLLLDRFGGELEMTIAAYNVAGELASMDAKRLRKMRARAISNADEHGL